MLQWLIDAIAMIETEISVTETETAIATTVIKETTGGVGSVEEVCCSGTALSNV